MAAHTGASQRFQELLRLVPVQVERGNDGRLFVRALFGEHAAYFLEAISAHGDAGGPCGGPARGGKQRVRADGQGYRGAPGARN
eukprot:3071480-Lingulodinium_polyedra.AAC.1